MGTMVDAGRLTDSWRLGPLQVPNRVVLAPLAGIGNWFVRLQAKRYGAGMTVSEMLSSHAIHYGNERTCTEMLRIHPREREAGTRGPVSIQLFGEDPAVMASAVRRVLQAGADAIDINMGCPVTKVRKTGAGAALLDDPERAVAVARAAVEAASEAVERGPGGDGEMRGGGRVNGVPAVRRAGAVPVTVKLRSGLRPGDDCGFELAHRLVQEAGVAAIAFHPRSASVHHKGAPDYELVARMVRTLPAPVILSGGLDRAEQVREAYRRTGVEAVMLARGALGNPWLFAQLVHGRQAEPTPQEVLRELEWLLERAVEHLGEERATRYMRKFYPWYAPRLGLSSRLAKRLQEELQSAPALPQARALLERASRPAALAA